MVFPCRRDFPVPFVGETPTSVFHLLQLACLEMAKISHKIHLREARAGRPSQHVMYHKFVYNRFMWGECVSICMYVGLYWCVYVNYVLNANYQGVALYRDGAGT